MIYFGYRVITTVKPLFGTKSYKQPPLISNQNS